MYARPRRRGGSLVGVFDRSLHPYAARPVGRVPEGRRPGRPVRARPACPATRPTRAELPAGLLVRAAVPARCRRCRWPSHPRPRSVRTAAARPDGAVGRLPRRAPDDGRDAAGWRRGLSVEFVSRNGRRRGRWTAWTCRCGAGEIVALVGESGSGKTTIARTPARAGAPDVGRGPSGRRAAAVRPPGTCAAAPARADGAAGRLRRAEPAAHRLRVGGRGAAAARLARATRGRTEERAGGRGARVGGPAPARAVLPPLPARALRWSAPAGAHRRRARRSGPSCWWPTSRSPASTPRSAARSSRCCSSCARSSASACSW